jgi:TolB protein
MAVFQHRSFHEPPGHAQLARIAAPGATAGSIKRASGAAAELLLESGPVDWFPHISPDARFASYLRFPSGTVGHPADLTVDVVVVSTDDWAAPLHTWSLFGGQGTLNVNSWSPDSTRLAYVAYPINDAHATHGRTPND